MFESTFGYQLAADLIVLVHFLFVIFVLFGALLLLWRRWLIWLHLPALVWGVVIELTGWICPLTPLENKMRLQAGLEMYSGDFVMHYIMPILYPQNLTRELQVGYGVLVILINAGIYIYLFRRKLGSKVKGKGNY